MTEPTFGITINKQAGGPRVAATADMSVIGIIGTAPAADAAKFPVDTPVFVYSDDASLPTDLGETGTLLDAVQLINAQLGDFQTAARIVIVRIEEGVDDDATIANIVGDGVATGLGAFHSAGPDLAVIPRIIVAPGYTHQQADPATPNPVVAALPAHLSKLLAHAIVDGPATDQATAISWRDTISSDRIIPVEPGVDVLDDGSTVTMSASPAIAGLAVRVDYEKGGLPFWSWANRAVHGILSPSRNIAFSLTDGATEGQALLNSNIGIILRGEMGVESAIASGGFVYVGTDTCSADALWQFYNQTRGRDYIHLTLLKTLRQFLGVRNINEGTIQDILNTMTSFLRDLQADGAILGFTVGFEKDQNTPENLRNGRFTVDFRAEEPPVLRRVDLRSFRYRPALDALLDDLIAQIDM